MGFILDLQDLPRASSADGGAVASISTDSWFLCQSDASNFMCITT